MKLLKLAGAALNQTPLDWEANFSHIVDAIHEAKKQQVRLLCLPELCITGYGCEDMFYAPAVLETALVYLAKIREHSKGIALCVGLPISYQNRIFNTSCMISDGKLLGFAAKRFLAGSGIHYEPRWFTPWPENEEVKISLPESLSTEPVPLGDLFFEIDQVKIGFEICEDAWVANRPGRKLYKNGVDIILNPSASHFAFGKFSVRQRFVLEGSRAFGVGYVYANLLGNEAGRAIYDGGVIIASGGELVALGERLSFSDVCLTTATIDISANRMAQSQASTLFNVPHMQGKGIQSSFSLLTEKAQTPEFKSSQWETSKSLKEEEFTHALALGLYDYMRKSRSKGFVVSLSGGADSAAVSSLVYIMVKLGIASIGLDSFLNKLSYFKEIQTATSLEEIMPRMLTTAYQGTRNSSFTTLNAAQSLANAISASFYNLQIDAIVEGYTSIVEQSLGRELSWQTDDVTLQNIQARVRAPSIWMYANIHNALLISTSNRSEAAVGYATMDGDTAGGISPIAGIDKAFLRSWLRWIEKEGTSEGISISALTLVNDQQPTAELRPQENNQTDEDDLMPYDLLDDIEEAAIRDKKMPLQCYLLLKDRYAQYSKEQLKEWIARFFRLWSRNQWKRERYAPSFHLDDKNLDPKTWCRFPILSGGFILEINQMFAYKE